MARERKTRGGGQKDRQRTRRTGRSGRERTVTACDNGREIVSFIVGVITIIVILRDSGRQISRLLRLTNV